MHFPTLKLEQLYRLNHFPQLRITIATSIEVAGSLVDEAANAAQSGPAAPVRRLFDRIANKIDQDSLSLQLLCSPLVGFDDGTARHG